MDTANLHPATEIALAWQPENARAKLAALLALDAHLGSLIGKTSEPLLAQIRLAWWRDRLSDDPYDRPKGDPVLDAVTAVWNGQESGLIRMVDGWEELLAPAPLEPEAIDRFAAARAQAFDALGSGARTAGMRWAFADFAFRTSNVDEREAALGLGGALPATGLLPRSLRGLAVLDALAARSIERGEPLMTGRGAALLAWRVGLAGR